MTTPTQDLVLDETLLVDMPAYLTPLIGRDADRQRMTDLLIKQGHRMVVITGSGGIGKTRLAMQAASDLQHHFRHGTRFLSFASVPEDADLDAAFAWHLGLRDVRDQTYRENIRHRLHAREQLLVIDNVEHVPHISDLLQLLLVSCASISLIVTSRSNLDIYGEVTHRVEPLSLDVSRTPWIQPDADRIAASPAVQLFTDRVHAADPDFALTNRNAGDVLAICNHLGGIPLALELTAPRLADRTPSALLRELEKNLDVQPQRSAAYASSRTLSLQDTMRLSYDMLGQDEQRVFRVLSIMRSQWTVDDVVPILAPDTDEMDAISVIDTLVTRSLIHPQPATHDEVRFSLNPVLRQFGRTMLAAHDEEAVIADRHATRMMLLAEEAEPEFTGKDQHVWLARIDALHEDFRLAHSWLLDHDREVESLQLSGPLWRYSYTRGHYNEVRSWIEASLATVTHHDALRSRALNGIGLLANMTGNPRRARELHNEALDLAARHNMYDQIAIGRIGLADLDVDFDGNLTSALRHLDIAAAAYEYLQDTRGIASVLTNRGNIQWHTGDLAGAYATHEEARVLYAQVNHTLGVAWADTNTGRIAAQQHRYWDAVPRLHAALDAYLTLGDGFGIAEIFEALAGVAVGTGSHQTASVLAGAATTLRDALDAPLKTPDLEEFQETLREAALAQSHGAAFARGCQLDMEEAVEIAMGMPVPERPRTVDTPDYPRLARHKFQITPREHQVLILLGEGLTDHEIARKLNLSPRTVQTYNASLWRKLDVGSRVAAVRVAHHAGIMPRRQHRGSAS